MSAWGNKSGGGGGFKSCNALMERIERNDPSLKELVILPMKTFNIKDVIRLSKALVHNTHLISISASGHAIDSTKSIKDLGQAIAKSNVRHLYGIGDQTMNDDDIIALCQGLSLSSSTLPKLITLDLSMKSISFISLSYISQIKSLQVLNVSRNSKIGSTLVFDNSPNNYTFSHDLLIELDISNCQLDTQVCQQISNGCLNLKVLKANYNPIDSLCIVDNLKHLTELHVAHCQITNLINNNNNTTNNTFKYLQVLDLSNNQICDIASNNDTVEFANLTTLNLSGNPLNTKADIKHLARGIFGNNNDDSKSLLFFPTLQTLDLSHVNCGITGAIEFLKLNNDETVKNTPPLSTLYLFNTQLGRDISNDQTLLQVLCDCLKGGHKFLHSLDIGGNGLNQESLVSIVQAIRQQQQPADFANTLKVLVIGGNEGGPNLEKEIENLKSIRPEIDIARDKPQNNDNNGSQEPSEQEEFTQLFGGLIGGTKR